MFCPKCGSLLIPKKDSGKSIMACSCGYKETGGEKTKITEVVEEQAEVVRKVFKLYTEDGLSINAIARWLNEHAIPTRIRNI